MSLAAISALSLSFVNPAQAEPKPEALSPTGARAPHPKHCLDERQWRGASEHHPLNRVSQQLKLIVEHKEGKALLKSLSFKGEPIEAERSYKVALNSYMAGGGSCCKALAELPSTNTAIPLRILFMNVIREGSPIKAPQVGRITVVGEAH